MGLVVATLAALVAWWEIDSASAPEPTQLAPLTLPRAGAVNPTRSADLTAVPPTDPALSSFVANTVLDVCGLSRLSVAREDNAAFKTDPKSDFDVDPDAAPTLDRLPAPVGRDALATARGRMLAALRSGDARSQIAALLLSPPASEDGAQRAAWAQTLLQQAADSQDATSLAAAEPACSYLPDAPTCRLGLIRARLRIEPDNARHWAALADEDPDAQDEAWAGLLRAKRWHESAPALLLASQAALPPDTPGYLRLALGTEVRLHTGSPPTPGEGFVLTQCQADLPQRREQCEALVQLMVERSDSPQTLAPAHKLAGVLGWSAARQQALQKESQTLLGSSGVIRDTHQPWACPGVEAWQRHITLVASVGELNALREHSRGSGLSPPQ